MEQDQINAGYENVAGTLKTQMKHLPKVFACGYCPPPSPPSSLNYLKVNGISRITINPNCIMTIRISLALHLFGISPVIYLVIYIKLCNFRHDNGRNINTHWNRKLCIVDYSHLERKKKKTLSIIQSRIWFFHILLRLLY